MRDIFYEELRRNSAEAMQLTAKQMDKVINAVKNVLRFHTLARKEGLLWLDTELGTLDMETEDKYFSELLMLVIDGIEPDLIKEYGLSRYFAANLAGYEGIIYLIYFKGSLMIYEGADPVIVELILGAMLPENVRKLYTERKSTEAVSD